MKRWYESRTLWLNSIAFVAFLIQYFTGNVWLLDTGVQATILGFLNLLLRFRTNESLTR